MALDSNGNAHAVYCEDGAAGVVYLTNASGVWESQTLSNTSSYDGAIATDAAGHVHIAYYDVAAGTLHYVTDISGAMTDEIVAGGGAVESGLMVQIRLDDAGHVHLVFLNFTESKIYYATNASGGWTSQVVAAIFGRFISFARNKAGTVYVAYWDNSDENIYLAENSGGAFVSEAIANNGFVTFTDLEIDDAGKLHMLVRESAALLYGVNSGGSWIFTPIDQGETVGFFGDMEQAPDGSWHAAFDGGQAIWHAVFPSGYVGG